MAIKFAATFRDDVKLFNEAFRHFTIVLERGKFELTSQDSADGKNFSVLRQVKKSGKALKSSLFSHWKWN